MVVIQHTNNKPFRSADIFPAHQVCAFDVIITNKPKSCNGCHTTY